MRLLLTLLAIAGFLTDHVNPMAGTDGRGSASPAAAFPFGMVQAGPDTRIAPSGPSYRQTDTLIYGFSNTHIDLPGMAEMCDILLMPVTGFTSETPLTPEEYASPFSKSKESARPGLYKVTLDKHTIDVRLTAGRRSGMHEYTYLNQVDPQVILSLGHRDRVTDGGISFDPEKKNVVKGWRRSDGAVKDQVIYYYIEFSSPIQSYRADGHTVLLQFRRKVYNTITARIGLSYTSEEKAMLNLMVDYPETFNDQMEMTSAEWECYLEALDCPFSDSAGKGAFYTAMYHFALQPSLASDINGTFLGTDGRTYIAEDWERLTNFSAPDGFRTFWPMMDKLAPSFTEYMISTLITSYDETGTMPSCEIAATGAGSSTYGWAPLFATAIADGITGFDVAKVLSALVRAAYDDGRDDVREYRTNGYVSTEDGRTGVVRTLEFAYYDWCIAQMAGWLAFTSKGDKQKAEACNGIYEEFMTSSQNWRNVFDPELGLMRARRNGMWHGGGLLEESFYVPHDIVGLMRAMGGREGMCSRLDELFGDGTVSEGMIGRYDHRRGIMQHTPFLYAMAGQAEKGSRVRETIMKQLYSKGNDGLCGSDAFGSLSAWYLLNALDEYNICPGGSQGLLTYMNKTLIVEPVFEVAGALDVQCTVSIRNLDPVASVWYRTGEGEFVRYEGAFSVSAPCVVEAYAEAADGRQSLLSRCVLGTPKEALGEASPDAEVQGSAELDAAAVPAASVPDEATSI